MGWQKNGVVYLFSISEVLISLVRIQASKSIRDHDGPDPSLEIDFGTWGGDKRENKRSSRREKIAQPRVTIFPSEGSYFT